MAHTLRYGRIDRVFTNVPFHSKVIGIGILIFFQSAALHFVLMRGIPGTKNDLAATAHGLRVGRHHGDGTEVVEDVLCGDSLGADSGFCEGDVFWDVSGEVVTDHQHVEMFVQSVSGVGSGWVGG